MEKFDLLPNERLDPELATLFAALEDGTREWLENLEDVSDEAVVWQIYPNGPSIGGLILHMASCSLYWLSEVALDEPIDRENPAAAYDLKVDQYASFWPEPPAKPFAWYIDLLNENRTEMLNLVARHNKPQEEIVRKNETYTYRWVLAHLVQHDSYHGGQIVMLNEIWKKLNPGK